MMVKERSLNFHAGSDTIKNVADWVRIYDLPVEYYDARVMTFIENRIGKMVKVDKNTLMQEHGSNNGSSTKFSCVFVSKSLLVPSPETIFFPTVGLRMSNNRAKGAKLGDNEKSQKQLFPQKGYG
ncbi:hypothetical protein KIW84_058267 [Lathyrus oleraceus]|uniref:DUF4283 domain-containing protein n=1 Tax=Pisum sativum TaxID=3888 RepID=A0A9D4X4I1_PEA|nr:hypothetical protein KIW84_058267 [Pisum sativum]